MLHGYCNAVKIADTVSFFFAARSQRSPICTMRCWTRDVTLLLEDLATIMSRARTENSLQVVAGGRVARRRQRRGQASAGDDQLRWSRAGVVGGGRAARPYPASHTRGR